MFGGLVVATAITLACLAVFSYQWTYEQAKDELEEEMIRTYSEGGLKEKIIYQTGKLYEEMISEYEEKN